MILPPLLLHTLLVSWMKLCALFFIIEKLSLTKSPLCANSPPKRTKHSLKYHKKAHILFHQNHHRTTTTSPVHGGKELTWLWEIQLEGVISYFFIIIIEPRLLFKFSIPPITLLFYLWIIVDVYSSRMPPHYYAAMMLCLFLFGLKGFKVKGFIRLLLTCSMTETFLGLLHKVSDFFIVIWWTVRGGWLACYEVVYLTYRVYNT